MRNPKDEREVVISFMTDEETASVYTSDYRYMNKLDMLVGKNPYEWKFIKEEKHDGDITGKFYQCPKKYISFRSKSMTGNTGRKLSPEHIRKMQEGRRSKTT